MDHDRPAASRTRRIPPKAATLFLAAAGLNGGCGMPALPELPAFPELPGIPDVIYRIDVQQGNIVDQERLGQLEIGMERRKVRFILGTPLLVDPFNQDRWDYVYSLRRGSGEEVTQRVSVYFVDDRLARIEDDLEAGAVPGSAAERIRTLVKVPKRQPPEEGVVDRLTPDFLKRDDEPADGTRPAAE